MSGILGQAAPSAGVWTDIYTVPATTVAVVRVIITNRAGTDATFRVAASPDGAAIADAHWIAGDKPIAGGDSGSSIAFVVNSSDVVRVYASSANLSFTCTGETRVE
jgi:hypothetical protein